jgi:AraC-like DNA-binding protein
MTRLTLDWLHLVALLGAAQGVFLAGVLATKRRNRTANRLLAVAMLAFSVHLATDVYHGAGLERTFPHFFGASFPLPFLYGPLIYLYAVTAADRSRRLTARDALHLVPFLVVVVAGLPIYLMSGAEKVAFYQRILAGDRPPLLLVADPLKLVSGVAYAVATLLFLRRHQERVKESYSSVERVGLRWLVRLGLATAGIWGLAVAFRVLGSTGLADVQRGDDVIALALAVLMYGIGYMGLRQPEVFRYETAEHPVPAPRRASRPLAMPVAMATPPPAAAVEPEPSVELGLGLAPESEPGPASPRYQRSGLAPWEAKRLRDALLAVMDREHPWKDSELTLADLADRLQTTPHKLSEVLNAQLCATFYDFVNGYRVREVQRRILAGEAERVTILSLALDAGFASKSTFNLVFKKHTGQTPSEFRQSAVAQVG